MQQDNNSSDKKNSRLGIDYELEGIAPNYVDRFAKINRIIGLIIVIAFVLWGLISSENGNRSPFETLLHEFGISSRESEPLAYFIAAVFFIAGSYFRFTVGSLITAILFKAWDLFKSLFKRI